MGVKGEKTRRYICEEARRLFAEKGFKDVTMKDICERTGLSRGGLYRHYESTAEIFLEIMEGFSGRQKEAVEDRICRKMPAAEILEEVLGRYEKEMKDSQSALNLAVYEFYSDPQISKTENCIKKRYEESKAAWVELICYGMENGEFRRVDPEAVYDRLVFAYQGVRMYSRMMEQDPLTPGRITDGVRETLLRK